MAGALAGTVGLPMAGAIFSALNALADDDEPKDSELEWRNMLREGFGERLGDIAAYGLPAALGAKLGCPKSKVVLFTGDGSIMMNCQEFATLHKYGVDVKTIVLHNNVLGMVNQWQRLFYNGHCAESLIGDNPDLTAVSASMGVPGTAVHKPEDLAKAVEALFKTEGPALLDVFIPADENVYPMVPGGKRLDQMVLGGEEK